MTVFVDTPALYAVLDADDANHVAARDMWFALCQRREHLLCTNYVVVETFALVQHRLGMEAVQTLQQDVLPVLDVEWVDEARHRAGVTALLAANRRRLSLVDCVSFETMRAYGIRVAFAFDVHFVEQGFECIP